MKKSNSQLIGLILFIATELMFFAGLLSSYWVIRSQMSTWPPQGQPRFPIAITALNTLILLSSALLMNWSIKKYYQHISRLRPYLLGSLLAGVGFLILQGYEWLRLIEYGLNLYENVYAGLFYLIVGAHALHMIAAVAALIITFKKLSAGAYQHNPSGLFACQGYWNFVVLLWPILYIALYLV